MNNSAIALDNVQVFEEETKDHAPWLREREGEILKIIDAIEGINSSKEWNILKNYIFDGLVETLESRMDKEANKNEINNSEIYRLQGQLVWARKYSNFDKLSQVYRLELTNIRNKLYGKNSNDGSVSGSATDVSTTETQTD